MSWTVVHAERRLDPPDPVAISIDILDEDHSLALALRRLVMDAELRDRLGRTAREYWAGRHTVGHMATDYERALRLAAERPEPEVALPAHLRPDPLAHARALTAAFGVAPRLSASPSRCVLCENRSRSSHRPMVAC